MKRFDTVKNGRSDGAVIEGEELKPGLYEALLHIDDYFAALGTPLPSPAFLSKVPLRFGVHDAAQRYHLAEDEILNPWHAALASAVSFVAGAILPFLTILLVPLPWRIPVTVLAVLLALALTGGLGAKLGDSPVAPAIWRVVIGGVLALGATYGIGALLGVAVG